MLPQGGCHDCFRLSRLTERASHLASTQLSAFRHQPSLFLLSSTTGRPFLPLRIARRKQLRPELSPRIRNVPLLLPPRDGCSRLQPIMSGIEVAGLVLGAIPLILAGLQFYGEGINVTKRYWKYKE